MKIKSQRIERSIWKNGRNHFNDNSGGEIKM